MSLSQFFGYFGSKHRLSRSYPPFRPFRQQQTVSNAGSTEAIWTNDAVAA